MDSRHDVSTLAVAAPPRKIRGRGTARGRGGFPTDRIDEE
jgi:hypothetical protein